MILLTVTEFSKVDLINITAILIMSKTTTTAGLLKTTAFWNKGYDVILYVYDAINKISLRDSNYIVNVVMWPKFGNSSITMNEITTPLILLGFDQMNRFF